MSVEELNKLILADPTTRQDNGKIKKAGKYKLGYKEFRKKIQ